MSKTNKWHNMLKHQDCYMILCKLSEHSRVALTNEVVESPPSLQILDCPKNKTKQEQTKTKTKMIYKASAIQSH